MQGNVPDDGACFPEATNIQHSIRNIHARPHGISTVAAEDGECDEFFAY
jgi:hypothetical protein